jgi:hypothetical protein
VAAEREHVRRASEQLEAERQANSRSLAELQAAEVAIARGKQEAGMAAEARVDEELAAARAAHAAEVRIRLGCTVAFSHRPSTLYQIP